MAFFGLGEKSASVDLLLNKEGAEASEKLALHERCTPKSEERLCDVQVLSRLGNEYLLKAGDQIFTLPKSAVISQFQTTGAGQRNELFPASSSPRDYPLPAQNSEMS